jgi:urea transporter
MTRPAGVTGSAVVAIIGSVVTLILAGLMFASPFIPEAQLPPTPNASPAAAAKFRWIMVAVYAVPFVIGVWWLVLFNRKSTREAFARMAAPGEAVLPPSA